MVLLHSIKDQSHSIHEILPVLIQSFRKQPPSSFAVVAVSLFFLSGCSSDRDASDKSFSETITGVQQHRETPDPKAVGHNLVKSSDPHERMIQVLAEIAANTADTNPYLGDMDVRKLQSEFDHLLPGQPGEELRIRTGLGFHLLRIGKNEKAINHLEAAANLVMSGQVASTEDSAETLILLTALAWLRKAEVENCLDSTVAETCIFPIVPVGVHQSPEAARKAMRYLQLLLERRPENKTARWLLNVAAMTVGDYPGAVPPKLVIPINRFDWTAPLARFENIARELGVDVASLSGGLIADDFDNDGWIDLMVSDCHPSGQLRLFRNLGGGKFFEVTNSVGLTGITGGLNIIQADYNNDGWVDVLVLRGAWLQDKGSYPNSLLENRGPDGFRDVSFTLGLAADHIGSPNAPTQTGSWADYDLDGDLDLCVGNETAPTQLFRNDGADGFTDVAEAAGIQLNRFVKGVIWGDYDHDGNPDLYVSCLDGPNLLYRNNGNSTFREVAAAVGVGKPERSFATWFWDFDNDGALDLFVTSYAASADDIAADYLGEDSPVERMCLYRGDGRGGFHNITTAAGLHRVAQPMGVNFGDIDNDGFLDFYLATGDIPYQALMPNLMFYNQRGAGFSDVTALTGLGHLQKGHGVGFADFDGDGDQDLAVELGGAFAGDVFRNAFFRNPVSGNHWISIQLTGVTANRSAIGARLRLRITEGGNERFVYRCVNSGGTFGANPLRQHIGIGAAVKVDELQIEWPNSTRTVQIFSDLAADQVIRISEGNAGFQTMEFHMPH